jgi:aromatic ring hydroxylase
MNTTEIASIAIRAGFGTRTEENKVTVEKFKELQEFAKQVAQREWVWLTEEDTREFFDKSWYTDKTPSDLIKAIQNKIWEKNT